MGPVRAVPLRSVPGLPSLPPPVPAGLALRERSAPLCDPRQGHVGRGASLLLRGPIGAECWWEWGVRPGRRSKARTGQKASGGARRKERRVTLRLSTSPACHLPAGPPMGLLGPCWVRWHCVQKSAPQVRQAGVGGSPGLSGTPGSRGCASGSKGAGTMVLRVQEGRGERLVLGEPREPPASL